ncbi:SurA N-terminal domain-containing protein [Paracoccus sp. (in: a-proteobacteria)]|uniref:SurA N-terminal domain-containing protein n=1 Tax=Paracoccus sp. TaxID=267 RepID=UPI0026E04EE2|nr:SurA N-terminal domain-containing protein [Paracoccus sp. (in: a-proteobacteria)]MDO5646525.1 SurA N-terminal domain-containing protein [Paracoccus sp. (in: a-proteobacteria)]
MSNLRRTGKSTIVWILMGLMVVGLGGFGITSFSGGSSGVGAVGDTKITADQYARALQSQMNALSQQTGRHISATEAQQIGLTQQVQAQLFTAASLAEQARLMGVSVGDQHVANVIASIPGFQGITGQFSRAAYDDFLRRERMSANELEETVRVDESRMLLQRAIAGGVVAPQAMVNQTTGWVLETRDISWRELVESDLPAAIAEPDEATLQAWHSANAARFTAPEIRRISYVWVTPAMLAPTVDLDEASLRQTYDAHLAEFQQPERRLVSRLVFPSEPEATAAKAQIDANEAPFEFFVLQRGLTLDAIDMGEVTQASLGAAGDAVFALQQPGVVGPVQTDLGPALFAVNAILDPVDVSFDQARDSLRAEAALDRAARVIRDRMLDLEDRLAGGDTLEQIAADTEMELGQIDWSETTPAAEGSIAGYQAFRDRAAAISVNDFPELLTLADGGLFALRLDEVVPPALIPFDDVRADVLADWRAGELHRQLLKLGADQQVAALAETTAPLNGAAPEADPAPEWTVETGLTRDSWMAALPAQALEQAFTLSEPGEVELVDAGDRVFLVRLDQTHAADLTGDDAQRIQSVVAGRLGQSLQADVFEFYARSIQRGTRIEVNQSAINAINAQVY